METRRYKVGLNIAKFYRNAMLACLGTFIVGVGVATGLVYYFFSGSLDHMKRTHELEVAELTSSYQREIRDLEAEHVRQITEMNSKHSNTQKRNEELEILYEVLRQDSEDEFELLRKYWYVLRDGPHDGTITTAVLKYADEQCERWNINPDWMWHIYMCESGWNIRAVNSKSGASGLGQVLPSTGASYWTKVLNHDSSFDRNMLFDPYINIEITVAHLGTDLESGSSFWDALNHYSGNGGQAYIDKVIAAARNHGITLTTDNYQYH